MKFPAEKFSFRILDEKLHMMERIINKYLQNRIGDNLDAVKGELIRGVDENGREYYEYTGTLSAHHSKNDIDKIRKMVLEVVDIIIQHSGYNLLVEFNDCNVVVEDRGLYREKEIAFGDVKKDKALCPPYVNVNKYDEKKKEEEEKELEDVGGKIIEPGPGKEIFPEPKRKREPGEIELEL